MNKNMIPLARKLRRSSTDTEIRLWQMLRSKQMGVKFRRQEVVGRYIVDFVCFARKLIIELDGGQHNQSSEDKRRDEWFKGQGFEVMRFWNNQVVWNLDGVYEKIEDFLKSTHPQPSPTSGEGEK